MSEHNDIARIERYLTQRMEVPERQSFETELAGNPALQEEVAAYRVLFDGFSDLRAGYFTSQLSTWSGEWAASDAEETELIEAYLADGLAASLKEKIEKRIANDSDFQAKVTQYRTLVSGLDQLKATDFSEKLQVWDRQSEPEVTINLDPVHITAKRPPTAKVRSLWSRVAVAAAILLLLTVGTYWYAANQYAGPNLVADVYQAPNLGNTMGGQQAQDDLDDRFSAAHQLLQAGDYPEAEAAFQQLQQALTTAQRDPLTLKYLRENATWSTLLAQVGAGQDWDTIRPQLQAIAADDNHEYAQEAQTLLTQGNGFLFPLGY